MISCDVKGAWSSIFFRIPNRFPRWICRQKLHYSLTFPIQADSPLLSHLGRLMVIVANLVNLHFLSNTISSFKTSTFHLGPWQSSDKYHISFTVYLVTFYMHNLTHNIKTLTLSLRSFIITYVTVSKGCIFWGTMGLWCAAWCDQSRVSQSLKSWEENISAQIERMSFVCSIMRSS